MTMSKKWYADGIQFSCQGSGRCCVSHGEYGSVYVTAKDRKKIADFLGVSAREFTANQCEKIDGVFRIKDGPHSACQFLKDKRCSIYEVRPTQCKTWPFWPETMSPKAWNRDVVKFCPGVGKGKIWTQEEIDQNVAEQAKWEHQLTNGK